MCCVITRCLAATFSSPPGSCHASARCRVSGAAFSISSLPSTPRLSANLAEKTRVYNPCRISAINVFHPWMSNRQGCPVTQGGGKKIYLQLFCNLCYNTNCKHHEVLPDSSNMQYMPKSTPHQGLYNLFKKYWFFFLSLFSQPWWCLGPTAEVRIAFVYARAWQAGAETGAGCF